jgi:hypothetical protein
MVRRGLTFTALAGLIFASCERQEEMAESLDLPDTVTIRQALHEDAPRDALLDTMPGGEMAIGDSAMEMELLKEKMPREAEP